MKALLVNLNMIILSGLAPRISKISFLATKSEDSNSK